MKDFIKALCVLGCIFGCVAGVYAVLSRSGLLRRRYMTIEES